MASTKTLQRQAVWHYVLTAAGGGVAVVVLIGLILVGHVRIAVAATVFLVVVALAMMHIRLAVSGTLVYLVFMGDLRRLLIPAAGWSGTDPLLLVGPALALLLFGYTLVSRSVSLDTPLSKWITALMVIMVLQIFNPLQGGLIVGIAGLLFYLIPLLWYWIGRTYATASFMESLIYKVIVPLALVAALMGYYQTFYGYLPYQQEWYEVAGYTALGSDGIQSSISFFASHSEYTVFLTVAMIALWAQVLKRQQYLALGLIAFLLVAVFLTGVRGPVVKFLVGASALWAILGYSTKTWITRGAFALCIGILGLTWSLSNLKIDSSNERVQHRVNRQVEGILGVGEEGSSAAGHLGMMLHGYKVGLQNPLGRGLGSTTRAAAKFGGAGGSMEVDSSDVFVSTGVVGGMVYLVIIILIIRSALRYWTATRCLVALALVGILVVTFLLWLRGGQYAVSALLWLCVGALDRALRDESMAWRLAPRDW